MRRHESGRFVAGVCRLFNRGGSRFRPAGPRTRRRPDGTRRRPPAHWPAAGPRPTAATGRRSHARASHLSSRSHRDRDTAAPLACGDAACASPIACVSFSLSSPRLGRPARKSCCARRVILRASTRDSLTFGQRGSEDSSARLPTLASGLTSETGLSLASIRYVSAYKRQRRDKRTAPSAALPEGALRPSLWSRLRSRRLSRGRWTRPFFHPRLGRGQACRATLALPRRTDSRTTVQTPECADDGGVRFAIKTDQHAGYAQALVRRLSRGTDTQAGAGVPRLFQSSGAADSDHFSQGTAHDLSHPRGTGTVRQVAGVGMASNLARGQRLAQNAVFAADRAFWWVSSCGTARVWIALPAKNQDNA